MAARRPSRQSQKRSDPRANMRREQDKQDNKQAMIYIGGGLVAVLMIVIFMMVGGDDSPPPKKDKKDNRPAYADLGQTYSSPTVDSGVPIWLSEQFLIALAKDDDVEFEKLVHWKTLFSRLDAKNNRDPKERYEFLEEADQRVLRDKFITKVMEPDFAEIVADKLLPYILDKSATWESARIEADYGNVVWTIKDPRDRKILEIIVKTELVPGFDAARDVNNKEAWTIVDVQYQAWSRTEEGVRKRHVPKSMADGFYKKKKKKKKKRTWTGPPEADPALVQWPESTVQSDRSDIDKLCNKTLDQRNPRDSDLARNQLMEKGRIVIPGILNALVPLDHTEDRNQIMGAWQLVQILREITGKSFGYAPLSSGMGFGQGGMTRATPEERVKAIRRWFGWWTVDAPKWDGKKYSGKEPETWEELGEEEVEEEPKKK